MSGLKRMEGLDAPVTEKTTASADGTPITYYLVGDGPRSWLMPPAMGAPMLAMKHIFERLQNDYTMVYWDMRGFNRSGAPRDREAYTIRDHIEDLHAVRRDAGLSSFVLGGWSMGVQLSLELCHRHPEMVRALVLINGPYERVLDSVVPLRALAPALTLYLRVARHAGPIANAISPMLGKPWMARTLEHVGLLAAGSATFNEVLAQFSHVHWGRYVTVMYKLHEHSAASYLAGIDKPTLITAGGKDRMTPLATAERMHRAIADSELFVIPEGTHYMPLEFPEPFVDRIQQFLREVDNGG